MTQAPSAADYDALHPQVLADPFPAFAHMRTHCPVHFQANANPPYYTLFRAEDIRAAALDPATWSSRYGNMPAYIRSVGVMQDPPLHTEFRHLFAARLAPRAVDALEGFITTTANGLIDRMLERDRGDLHDDFACPLPVAVIGHILGVDPADAPRFKQWSDDISSAGFGLDDTRFFEVYGEVATFFRGCVARRREALAAAGVAAPGEGNLGREITDDVISRLTVATFQGRPLTDHEIEFTLMGLMIGGNETTTSLITNCMWRLLEVPERWARVRREPALVETALEESLRFDPPTLSMWRTTLCPVQVHGVEIPAKSKVRLAWGSANRDPALFDHPEEFSLDRPPEQLRRHMAFGAGAHFCPGAPLSRREAAIALRLFVERLPDIRLAGPHTRIGAFNFWGRRTLPVAWR